MDIRDREEARGKWYASFDERRMTATILVINDETEDEEEREIPVEFQMCDLCEGKGKHVNPGVDQHGISPEEFAEDPDFYEDYRSGVYDVACYKCGGRRVVPVPSTVEDRKIVEHIIKQQDDFINEV